MKGIIKNISVKHIMIIFLTTILSVLFLVRNGHILGFGGDWFLQSVSFYEYFRDLLYETGDFFPNLAPHIGGGQNIYYIAYYGLFSPYLLLFYCLPFVRAGDFLMVTGVINIIVSSILLYVFLQKNNFSKNLSLLGALLFSVSTGMMFFNYTFIMFVQYMPFFMLGLIATKKYLDTNKSMLLIVSVFLLILTSFYFSIPAIVCLCLYALYYYMKINKKLIFKQIIIDGLKYVFRIIISIILSSFLLFPIAYVVLSGRTSPASGFELSDLFFGIDIEYLMYDSNGLGLSAIVIIAIIYNILFLKKENKYLGIVLLLVLGIPFVNIILNGFLYESGKILLAFLPFCIILILEMINSLRKASYMKILLAFFISILFIVCFMNFELDFYKNVLFIDLVLTLIILLFYKRKNTSKCLFVFAALIFVISVCFVDNEASFMTQYKYNKLYEDMNIDMSKYINNGTSSIYRTEFDTSDFSMNYSDAKFIYRTAIYSSTYNKKYRDILDNTLNNNIKSANMLITRTQENLFINKFMGVRYLFSRYDAPYGYQLINEYDRMNLYENKNVNAIGFFSSNLLNSDEYSKLSYIDKLLAYYNNIIVKDDSKNRDLEYKYQRVEIDSFEIKEQDGVSIVEKDGMYVIESEPYGKLIFDVNKKNRDKVLVIRFIVDDKYACDMDVFYQSISINGIQNMITCDSWAYYNNNTSFDYVVSSNDNLEELNISFYQGVYKISNIEIYAIEKSFFDNNNTIPIEIDFDKTKGDVIEGNINVLEDGYFVFTLPYDKGYTAYVDDKEVDIEQVSNGFIGFKINRGNHKIRLTFEAPFTKVGMIFTFIGFIVLVLLNNYEHKKKDK